MLLHKRPQRGSIQLFFVLLALKNKTKKKNKDFGHNIAGPDEAFIRKFETGFLDYPEINPHVL